MSYWDDVFYAMHILNLQHEEEEKRRIWRSMAESGPHRDDTYESEEIDIENKETETLKPNNHIEQNCGPTHSLVVEFVVFDASGVHNEFYCLRCRKSLPELKGLLRRNYISVQIDKEEEIPAFLDILQEEANRVYQEPTFPIKYIVSYLTNYAYDIKLDSYRNSSRKG